MCVCAHILPDKGSEPKGTSPSSTNGAAENMNLLIEHYQQTNWVEVLLFAEVASNNLIHSSIGFTSPKIATGAEFVPEETSLEKRRLWKSTLFLPSSRMFSDWFLKK